MVLNTLPIIFFTSWSTN